MHGCWAMPGVCSTVKSGKSANLGHDTYPWSVAACLMPDSDHTALLLYTWTCMLQNESFVSDSAAIHYQPIETYQHHRPYIPRLCRLCPQCPLSSLGDEYHLVFECPNLKPPRDKYQTLFNPYTTSMRRIA